MRILFRKSDGFLRATSLFDWQVIGGNGTWYRIRAENIHIPNTDQGALTRKIMNAALSGKTLTLEAAYFRNQKILAIKKVIESGVHA